MALATALVGCAMFESTFDIAVGNRTASTVSIFANGDRIGDVGANQTATFSIEENPIGRITVDATGSPTSPEPIAAQVTFSARDVATGALSAGVAATLLKNVTTYVDVAPCVVASLIDAGSAPPCLSVASGSGSVSNGTNGSQGPVCTFTLSGTSQSFSAAGGTGTVSVTTASGCAWTATSSQPWLTVVRGSSGTGNGEVVFEVAPNITGQARVATLTIGGRTFTVNQTA